MKIAKSAIITCVILFLTSSAFAQDIFEAAKNGNIDKVKELVENDPSLAKTKDKSERTPLHWAARGVHLEVLAYLVSQGADVNAQDINYVTPLISVCARGHDEAAEILINNNADVTVAMSDRSTPLHLAAASGNGELVTLLLDRGAPLDVRDFMEDTPLHSAAQSKKWEVVILIANHPTAKNSEALNLVDFDGNTALHLASRAGQLPAVKSITAGVVDVNLMNSLGETAYNLAELGGLTEITNFLARLGADTGPQKFPEITGPYLGQKPPDTVPQLFAKGIVSTRIGMYGTIVFAPDGREAFWKPEMPKMYYMNTEGGTWTAPREYTWGKEESINVPFYSLDGQRLFFMVGSDGNEGIWFAERDGEGWSEPKPFDSVINSNKMHWQFSFDKAGNVYLSTRKIFCARLVDGRYLQPEPLPAPINPGGDSQGNFREGNVGPHISPDGDFLIFTKFRASRFNPIQLYISFKNEDGSWTEPKNLSEKLQTEGNDSAARISPDGKYLFFQSVRKGSGASRGLYWVDAKIIEELRPAENK